MRHASQMEIRKGKKYVYINYKNLRNLLTQQSCSKKRDWLVRWKIAEQGFAFCDSFSIVFLFQRFLLILVFLSLHQIWSCGETKYFSFTVRDFLCTAPGAALGETVQQLNHVSNWGQALKLKLNSSWQRGVFYNPLIGINKQFRIILWSSSKWFLSFGISFTD